MKLDYREKKLVKYWPDAEITNLISGDILENGFCIERKGANDFLSSILNHHVFNQAITMYKNYPGKCAILVEGDLKSLPNTAFFGGYKISSEGIRGAIASLYTKYNVPVLLCSTRSGFVEMTNKLLQKHKDNLENGNDVVFIQPPVCKVRSNPKLQVLMQVPGFGQKKATKILEHYIDFSNIGKMERPKGISQKDLELIQEILK